MKTMTKNLFLLGSIIGMVFFKRLLLTISSLSFSSRLWLKPIKYPSRGQEYISILSPHPVSIHHSNPGGLSGLLEGKETAMFVVHCETPFLHMKQEVIAKGFEIKRKDLIQILTLVTYLL